MSKKIEVYIPGFGKRYCSDNVEFCITKNYIQEKILCFYYFYGKYTNHNKRYKIYHNEYGPAVEKKDKYYQFWINGKLHNLNGPAYYSSYSNYKEYWINGKMTGYTEKEFIEYKNQYLLIG